MVPSTKMLNILPKNHICIFFFFENGDFLPQRSMTSFDLNAKEVEKNSIWPSKEVGAAVG